MFRHLEPRTGCLVKPRVLIKTGLTASHGCNERRGNNENCHPVRDRNHELLAPRLRQFALIRTQILAQRFLPRRDFSTFPLLVHVFSPLIAYHRLLSFFLSLLLSCSLPRPRNRERSIDEVSRHFLPRMDERVFTTRGVVAQRTVDSSQGIRNLPGFCQTQTTLVVVDLDKVRRESRECFYFARVDRTFILIYIDTDLYRYDQLPFSRVEVSVLRADRRFSSGNSISLHFVDNLVIFLSLPIFLNKS